MLIRIDKAKKEGISLSRSQAFGSKRRVHYRQRTIGAGMHLNSLLLVALLLLASGFFWWWTFGSGFFAVIAVVVLGVGAVLYVAVRGDRTIKDELDAQVPDNDAGSKEL